MRRIFLAGPITPRGRRTDCQPFLEQTNLTGEYLFNVTDFIAAENALLCRGWAPFNPAKDLLNFLVAGPSCDLTPFIEPCDLAWLEVCDAILMLPGWETSKGAVIEHQRAAELGMPIYYSIEEVPDESA